MITIVGAGALGSHVALFLRNEKLKLRVLDFDRVEMKNTQAQFHTKMGLGTNKVVALAKAFNGLFGVAVEAFPHKLRDDNAEQSLGGSDLVIDCTDNFNARFVIMAAVRKLRVPCLHGTLSASGDFGRVSWTEDFIPDSESGDAAATCIDGEHLPFFATVSAHLALEAQSFLRTGKKRSYQITPSGIVRVA
jgi:predicted ThiF/HesA family dinucleotide-utilizing enzyme